MNSNDADLEVKAPVSDEEFVGARRVLRSWELNGREGMRGGRGVVAAETAEDAVAAALAALR